MKKIILPVLWSLSLIGTMPAAQAGQFFEFSTVPTEVQLAHESFFKGNYEKMCDQIKVALMAFPNDPSIKQNLLDLYDRALAVRGKTGINAGMKLPAGAQYMSIGIRKRLNLARDLVNYQITAGLDHLKGDELDQLRIVAYPNKVILDKQNHIGEFDASAVGENMMSTYGGSAVTQAPAEDGLYLVEVKLRNSEKVTGYFLVSKMNAKESPEVLYPTQNAEIPSGRPIFTWRDFVSSDYRSFESRKIGIRVSHYETGEDLWGYYAAAPQNTSIEYGIPAELYPQGVPPITAGKYTMRISYRERYRLGELGLSRESVTIVPFTVK